MGGMLSFSGSGLGRGRGAGGAGGRGTGGGRRWSITSVLLSVLGVMVAGAVWLSWPAQRGRGGCDSGFDDPVPRYKVILGVSRYSQHMRYNDTVQNSPLLSLRFPGCECFSVTVPRVSYYQGLRSCLIAFLDVWNIGVCLVV